MNNLEEKRTAREAAARAAIKNSLGTLEGEGETDMFISHHLEELDADYWKTHTGTATPEPSQVLDLLEYQPRVDEDEADVLASFDFTLPGDVTQYVLCVRFSEEGEVVDLVMES